MPARVPVFVSGGTLFYDIISRCLISSSHFPRHSYIYIYVGSMQRSMQEDIIAQILQGSKAAAITHLEKKSGRCILLEMIGYLQPTSMIVQVSRVTMFIL